MVGSSRDSDARKSTHCCKNKVYSMGIVQFEVKVGVHQGEGSVFSPKLFIIMTEAAEPAFGGVRGVQPNWAANFKGPPF